MLRLNRYILALVLWLSFLFNIERLDLDIGKPDVFNISYSVYMAAVGLILVGLLLPHWKRRSLWAVETTAVIAFAMDPTGQLHGPARISRAKLAACVGAIGVHKFARSSPRAAAPEHHAACAGHCVDPSPDDRPGVH